MALSGHSEQNGTHNEDENDHEDQEVFGIVRADLRNEYTAKLTYVTDAVSLVVSHNAVGASVPLITSSTGLISTSWG